jgi:hypothetical protein
LSIAKSIFFIAGAPKTATSALYEYLTRHPEIYRPHVKEFHHFCDDFFSEHMSDEEYLRAFAAMTPDEKLAPDGSVLYMYSDVALRRIKAFNPGANIIIMLRHPVDLVHSWHSQLLWNLNESEHSFALAWALCEDRARGLSLPQNCEEPFVLQYKEIGQLGKYLQRVYSVFPHQQVKLIFMEDMRADTAAIYADVLDFIGASPFELPEYRNVNTNTELRSRSLMRLGKMQLSARSRRAIARAKALLGLRAFSFRRLLINASTVETERKPIDPQLAQELLAFFRADIEKLSAITQRNLDHWLNRTW